MSWIPYAGPVIAALGLAYGMTKKDDKSGSNESQVQKQENEDFIKDVLERQYA